MCLRLILLTDVSGSLTIVGLAFCMSIVNLYSNIVAVVDSFRWLCCHAVFGFFAIVVMHSLVSCVNMALAFDAYSC